MKSVIGFLGVTQLTHLIGAVTSSGRKVQSDILALCLGKAKEYCKAIKGDELTWWEERLKWN